MSTSMLRTTRTTNPNAVTRSVRVTGCGGAVPQRLEDQRR
jgi:hypothetical protein